MNPLENSVCGFIPAFSFPPTFDDAPVVAIYFEVAATRMGCEEGVGNKFEADSFCPTNVSLACQSLPAGDESPSSPVLANDDGDVHS